MKIRRFVLAPALALPLLAWDLSAREWKVPADFPTIQAAIDAASPGDHVVVAPGVYQERVRLAPGVRLRSEGGEGSDRAEETILDGGGDDGTDRPGVQMAEDSSLDGFTIRNVGLYRDDAWQEQWEEQGSGQPYERIGEPGTPGVAAEGVNCSVTNNRIHHNGGNGIVLSGKGERSGFARVEGNECYRNMGGGIGATDGAMALIHGNRCYENFFAGIGHENASPLVIENECFRNIRAGIGVSEGASPIVRGNRCHGNRRAGIGVRTGAETRPVIEDNACFENAMAGIGIDDGAAPVVRGNRCERNGLAGIGSRGGARPLVVGNVCAENAAAGIGISDGSAAVVAENECVENRTVAIGVPGASAAVLIGNRLVRSEGMPPLISVLDGSSAAIVGNELKGGGIAGILVSGNARIVGNELTGRGSGSGIWIRGKGEAEISGNRLEGYAAGVRGLPEPEEN